MLSKGESGPDSLRDPLAGIRVLDFTIVMSGPMCTRALADAGADVIKVEAPVGDVVRARAPHRGGFSTYFAAMNCGKRSTVIDLQMEEGKRLARELAQHVDIVVENFRPGVMTRLGLDYDSLSRTNERLIYCSISGFGQHGPMASAPAYAPVIHAWSGYEVAHAEYQHTGGRPSNNGIFIADVLGAAHAASAIQLALFDRERTGCGQHIDVSLLDCMVGMLVYEMQAAQFPPEGRRQVYQPVRSADGYVMVAAVTPRNLEVLFDVIGYPQGKTDPRFADVRSKEANWDVLLDIIEAWTSQRSGAECERILMKAGVPCARYRAVGDVMQDPHIEARDLLAELSNDGNAFKVANAPYQLSRRRIVARRKLPNLGGDTRDVLKQILGKSDDELDCLVQSGVIRVS